MRTFLLIFFAHLALFLSAQKQSVCESSHALPNSESFLCASFIEEQTTLFLSSDSDQAIIEYLHYKHLYDSLFTAYCTQYALPEEFKLIPLALTHMQNIASTPHKAGIWALSPLVATRNGLRIDQYYDQRYDIELSTKVAFEYLNQLYSFYNNNYWLTILAFINSPLELQQFQSTLNHNDSFPTALYHSSLNKKEVISNLITFAYLDNYYPTEPSNTELPKPTVIEDTLALTVFCNHLKMTSQQFFTQNPAVCSKSEYLYPNYRLYISAEQQLLYLSSLSQMRTETKEALAIALAKQLEKEKQLAAISEPIIYRVKSGDTLGHIAQRHNVTVAQIKRWNNLKSDMLQIGQRLKIERP